MPTLFRTHFQINAEFDAVRSAIQEWAASLDGLTDEAVTTTLLAGDGNAAWQMQFEWRRRWHIEARVAHSDCALHFDAMVRSETALRPTSLPLAAALLDRFPCLRDGRALTTKATSVEAGSLDDFLGDAILGDHRSLPTIGVSRNDDGATAVDPNALQRRLAGLGTVAVWNNDFSRALAGRLGRRFACYNGAIRLYAPNPTRNDDRDRHPLFLWSAASKAGFEQEITELAVHLAISADQPSKFEGTQRRIRESMLMAATSAATDAQREVQRLLHENQELRRQLDAAAEYLAEERPGTPEELHQPQTVAEAVQLAESRFEHLDLLPGVPDAAKQSRYHQPQKVFAELRRLNMLAGRLAEGLIAQPQIVPWLKGQNVDVSTESEDTMRRYGDQRLFRDRSGHLHEMQLHIKLGGGTGQDNHCRIHFNWHPLTQQIRIGHVGRHLQTAQT